MFAVTYSLIFSCQKAIGSDNGLIQALAAIHISSTISDGMLGIDEIEEIAKQIDNLR